MTCASFFSSKVMKEAYFLRLVNRNQNHKSKSRNNKLRLKAETRDYAGVRSGKWKDVSSQVACEQAPKVWHTVTRTEIGDRREKIPFLPQTKLDIPCALYPTWEPVRMLVHKLQLVAIALH